MWGDQTMLLLDAPMPIDKERMASLMNEIRLKASQPSVLPHGRFAPVEEHEEIPEDEEIPGASTWAGTVAQLGPMRRQHRSEQRRRPDSSSVYARPPKQIVLSSDHNVARSFLSSSAARSLDLSVSPLSLRAGELTPRGVLPNEPSPSATGASSPETATSSGWPWLQEAVAAKPSDSALETLGQGFGVFLPVAQAGAEIDLTRRSSGGDARVCE